MQRAGRGPARFCTSADWYGKEDGMELNRKFGLVTAVCMVVGTVIGSGVFFKAQTILVLTGGDLPLGILAWALGGSIMLICSLAFAVLATRYEKVNGLVDYAEATVGKGYAYFIGWFSAVIYTPTLTSVLAWLSARYTLVFLTSLNPALAADPVAGPECMVLTLFYLCLAYAVNTLGPRLAGKLQVSTTVVKLIPLCLMAVVGTIYGLTHGITQTNFAAAPVPTASGNPLFAALVSTAFAYEGWIITTSINAELRDARRNLPRALILGALIVVGVYVAYYVGVAGGVPTQMLMEQGASVAFTTVFGSVFGSILNLFVAVSCLGTTNGLMLGCIRGFYALAVRGQGPRPKTFASVDRVTNLPANSAAAGLAVTAAWFVFFYLAQLSSSPDAWLGPLAYDSSELPIITLYALYLPILVMFMVRARQLDPVRRFVIPVLACGGSCFMIVACIYAHGVSNLWYLLMFAVIMAVGMLFYRRQKD